jgi:Bifunctional DNA primase/polymerase, N-terminal
MTRRNQPKAALQRSVLHHHTPPEGAAMSALDAALAYAALGLPVFPCLPRGKEPAVRRGFHAATTNPETIRRYWRVADRNIGVRTGMAARVWILDVDGDGGEVSLRALEAKNGALPAIWQSITPRGRHVWFRCDSPILCSTSKVAPGLDVRGDGGYAVVPPSIHPSGRAYAWSINRTTDLAIAPDWLLQLARKRPTISQRAVASMHARRTGSPGAYGQAALDQECAALAGIAPGGRNHSLNRAAFNLFQLVAVGELDRDQVVERLIDASHCNGLVADDGMRAVMATIHSGGRAGLHYPRERGGS